MANQFDLAERLVAVARKEKAKWLAAAKRESKKHDDFAEDREDACLSGAQTVAQVIALMERELRLARYAAQGTEARRAETENTGSVHDGPVAESDAPTPCSPSDNLSGDGW